MLPCRPVAQMDIAGHLRPADQQLHAHQEALRSSLQDFRISRCFELCLLKVTVFVASKAKVPDLKTRSVFCQRRNLAENKSQLALHELHDNNMFLMLALITT